MDNKKTILIAGASSGIGFELAKSLTAKGHEVIAINRLGTAFSEMPLVRFLQHDFMSDDEMPHISDTLDGLIYCPGSINLKPFHAIKNTDLVNDFKINVAGAFSLIQTYLPNLKQAEQPSIVLFSSVAAQTGMPFHSSIATSKAAIEGLTKALAAELAPKIRVNAIAPSLTATPLAEQLLNSDLKKNANAERHPLKRIGQASDIAEMAEFLLLNGGWITGQIIGINGGLGSVIK